MHKLKLSTEELGRLLYKAQHEPRRNQKRFLKDRGGEGSADELDQILVMALQDKEAIIEHDRLEAQRKIAAKSVELNVDSRVAEMISAIRIKMESLGMTQQDVADACGWKQPLVATYLTSRKEPGAKNLAKLASAVGCHWRLTEGLSSLPPGSDQKQQLDNSTEETNQ